MPEQPGCSAGTANPPTLLLSVGKQCSIHEQHIGDYKIVTTLCPGGKERMRRLMSMVQTKRFDPTPLLTHSFRLDQIVEAYDLFGTRRDGVLKVAIRP